MRNLFIILISTISLSCYAQDIVVRHAGQDNVHTYRIPALATSTKGTLLAAWDNRIDGSRDLQGDIDIGLCRSTDGGQSWLPLQRVLDMGQWGGMPEKFNGVSDAQILIDHKTGRIWIAGLWMHGILNNEGQWINGLTANSTEWQHQWVGRGSQAGYSPKQTCQFLLTYSDDDGINWSEPINITESKPEHWWLFAPAPGQGITMNDGTLVMPTQGRDSTGVSFSNITYSQDNGKTWITSNHALDNTTECAIVELQDGVLMLNMRDNRNHNEKGTHNGRAVYITHDMGQTWTQHPSSHGALIEPVCMASLHKHYYGGGKSILLFSNPASKTSRNNIRLKASLDNGLTWSQGILLDADDNFGYSCITSVNEQTIGVLWEGSKAQMVFKTINLNDILEDANNNSNIIY